MSVLRILAVVLGLVAAIAALTMFGRDEFEETQTAEYLFIIIPAVAALYLWVRATESGTPTRDCPRCGRQVEVGVLDCPHCEFDFRTIGT